MPEVERGFSGDEETAERERPCAEGEPHPTLLEEDVFIRPSSRKKIGRSSEREEITSAMYRVSAKRSACYQKKKNEKLHAREEKADAERLPVCSRFGQGGIPHDAPLSVTVYGYVSTRSCFLKETL